MWFNYSSSESTIDVLTSERIRFWHNPISGRELKSALKTRGKSLRELFYEQESALEKTIHTQKLIQFKTSYTE